MGLKNIANGIWHFIKNETVLSVAVILAVISSFFITPDIKYLNYIDFRTIGLLFCLMTVMAGLQKTGVFSFMAENLLKKIHSTKSLIFILVMLCFFFSMLITNDVALITFVPFTFTVLDMLGGDIKNQTIIPVVAMQTVAANLGSMLTPIGNPQNLYLHGISGLGVGEFMLLMLPYTVISFVLLSAWALLRKGKGGVKIDFNDKTRIKNKGKVVIHSALFCVCLLTVAHALDYRIMLLRCNSNDSRS